MALTPFGARALIKAATRRTPRRQRATPRTARTPRTALTTPPRTKPQRAAPQRPALRRTTPYHAAPRKGVAPPFDDLCPSSHRKKWVKLRLKVQKKKERKKEINKLKPQSGVERPRRTAATPSRRAHSPFTRRPAPRPLQTMPSLTTPPRTARPAPNAPLHNAPTKPPHHTVPRSTAKEVAPPCDILFSHRRMLVKL
uniref:Uncharacterized protein n=1 Tax=Knipowitschia caucasica TaxID=637954 RepID=A0AAV2K620_KNICA